MKIDINQHELGLLISAITQVLNSKEFSEDDIKALKELKKKITEIKVSGTPHPIRAIQVPERDSLPKPPAILTFF